MGTNEKKPINFSGILNKASDFGKKAANEIQKSAKDLGDQTQKAMYEQRMKKYNPLFPDKFFSDNFALPNVIKIVDDAERRDIDVCQGAIGWTQKVKGVEILYLYDEFIRESKINFVPFVRCDSVYCLDSFERNKYVNVDKVFERSLNEKMAELENVANCLGAKSCSIEIIEMSSDMISFTNKQMVGNNDVAISEEYSTSKESKRHHSAKNISYFEGNSEPKVPALKWFRHDDNIKNLIDARCGGANNIKSKMLVFKGSSSVTMSTKVGAAIDKLVQCGSSFEKKAIEEHSMQMIFEIEF